MYKTRGIELERILNQIEIVQARLAIDVQRMADPDSEDWKAAQSDVKKGQRELNALRQEMEVARNLPID